MKENTNKVSLNCILCDKIMIFSNLNGLGKSS